MSARALLNESPSRADQRLIAYVVDTFFKKKDVQHVPEEFEHVARVFAKAGGSWERLFKGSVTDIVLLRRIVKVAIDAGHLSRVPKFR